MKLRFHRGTLARCLVWRSLPSAPWWPTLAEHPRVKETDACSPRNDHQAAAQGSIYCTQTGERPSILKPHVLTDPQGLEQVTMESFIHLPTEMMSKLPSLTA